MLPITMGQEMDTAFSTLILKPFRPWAKPLQVTTGLEHFARKVHNLLITAVEHS